MKSIFLSFSKFKARHQKPFRCLAIMMCIVVLYLVFDIYTLHQDHRSKETKEFCERISADGGFAGHRGNSIHSLDLSNVITAGGISLVTDEYFSPIMEFLEQEPHRSRLRKLYLDNAEITDKTASRINAFTNIWIISLSGTRINGEGLFIEPRIFFPKLQNIEIDNSGISISTVMKWIPSFTRQHCRIWFSEGNFVVAHGKLTGVSANNQNFDDEMLRTIVENADMNGVSFGLEKSSVTKKSKELIESLQMDIQVDWPAHVLEDAH